MTNLRWTPDGPLLKAKNCPMDGGHLTDLLVNAVVHGKGKQSKSEMLLAMADSEKTQDKLLSEELIEKFSSFIFKAIPRLREDFK